MAANLQSLMITITVIVKRIDYISIMRTLTNVNLVIVRHTLILYNLYIKFSNH